MSRFVILEGPNGAGKTSLLNSLKKEGYSTLSSPNGTPLSKMLRPACRGTEPWEDIDKKVQFLLFSAARLDEYIRCVEQTERFVIADRWWTSTYVYQCILQGISIDLLEQTIHEEEKIDKVIILDGDDDILFERVRAERAKNKSHGVCTWTKENDTMKKLNSIYRTDLPKYLESKNVPYEIIDTTFISQEEVFEKAKKIIGD